MGLREESDGGDVGDNGDVGYGGDVGDGGDDQEAFCLVTSSSRHSVTFITFITFTFSTPTSPALLHRSSRI